MRSKVIKKFNLFVPNDVPSQCFEYVDRTNPVIVQIGANDGLVGEEYGFHEFLSELNSFDLHLVEPIKKYFDNLSFIYDKFSDDNKIINYHNLAITNEEKSHNMIDLGGCSYISHSGGLSILGLTWDSFVSKNKIESIDLLLLDCEGYEYNILSSINYEKTPISIIRYEYIHASNKEEMDEFLKSKGYSIHLCDTDPIHNKVAIKQS